MLKKDSERIYLKRPSLFHIQDQRMDKDIDLGYDWRGNMYKNYTSSFLFKIEMLQKFIPMLEEMMNFLVDKTKEIKKTFAYAVDKNSRNIN